MFDCGEEYHEDITASKMSQKNYYYCIENCNSFYIKMNPILINYISSKKTFFN